MIQVRKTRHIEARDEDEAERIETQREEKETG